MAQERLTDEGQPAETHPPPPASAVGREHAMDFGSPARVDGMDAINAETELPSAILDRSAQRTLACLRTSMERMHRMQSAIHRDDKLLFDTCS
jgi:hypothetical protein